MIKIKMTNRAYLKLRYYIEGCDSEISGLGKVREITNKGKPYLEIYDLEILPQEVSSVSSDLDEDALANFLLEKLKKGINTEPYKVWWHSHADMPAFFSPGDIDTIKNSTEFPYLISIVSNKDSEMEIRVDAFKPIRFTAKKIKLVVEEVEDKKLRELCQKQIQQKVREAPPIMIQGAEEEEEEIINPNPAIRKWGKKWRWNGIRDRY